MVNVGKKCIVCGKDSKNLVVKKVEGRLCVGIVCKECVELIKKEKEKANGERNTSD